MGFLALIVFLDREQAALELVFKKQQPEMGYRQEFCRQVSHFKAIKEIPSVFKMNSGFRF